MLHGLQLSNRGMLWAGWNSTLRKLTSLQVHRVSSAGWHDIVCLASVVATVIWRTLTVHDVNMPLFHHGGMAGGHCLACCALLQTSLTSDECPSRRMRNRVYGRLLGHVTIGKVVACCALCVYLSVFHQRFVMQCARRDAPSKARCRF